MRHLPLFLLAVLMPVVLSCDDSGTGADGSFVTSDATALLGLKQDFHCRYVEYDSLITYPPFRISVDTTFFSFSGIATDASRSQFDLSFDSTKTAALRITTNSVVNLGYYQWIDGRDSFLVFSEPPELFPVVIMEGRSWDSYTPPVFGIVNRLFLSWGFEAARRFERRESILLPLGAFSCYVFSCEYRLPGDEEPFVRASEYYADGYGLVKLHVSGSSGSSQVFMISRDTMGL